MLKTLIRQECLAHLMSARFFAAVIITLLLVVANAFVLLEDYERRLERYTHQETVHQQKAQEAKTYSTLKLFVERPPNPLALFSTGLDKRLGGTLEIYHGSVPMITRGSAQRLDNPFLNLFSKIDLVFIFQVVLSLIALLFAYGAVVGDRESGTLRLVISHPVRRGTILIAKYMSAMLCLLIPVLMSLLVVLLLLTINSSMQLSGQDFIRIGGVVLTTSIYLSVFYLIGLLISTTTRRTATSLMLCMFVWVVLVLVYPNWSRFSINPVGDTQGKRMSTEQQVNQIWEESDREQKRLIANSPLQGDPPKFNLKFHEWGRSYGDRRNMVTSKVKQESEPLMPHLQNYNRTIETLHIRLAEQTALMRKQTFNNTIFRQAKWDEYLMKISPIGLYNFAASAWVGTDLEGMYDFVEATKQYRRSIIDYFHEKDAFGSRQWFDYSKGVVDWWDLPQFKYKRADIWENASRALPELLFLFLFNIVLFIVTFLIFIRNEV